MDEYIEHKENTNNSQIPWMCILLVAVNGCIWIVMEILGDTTDAYYMMAYGASYMPLIIQGEWWRLFTCMFLHFGAEHLVNNMFMLVVMGMRLEYVLGKFAYLILYLGAGLTGSVLSFVMKTGKEGIMVSAGASGAVFGITGGLLATALWNGGKVEGLTTKGLLIMLALSLYHGMVETGVDNWAHIGGFAGGFVIASIFAIIRKFEKH